MKPFFRYVAVLGLVLSGSAEAFVCSCQSPLVAQAIRLHMQVDRTGYQAQLAILKQQLPQINDGVGKLLSAHEQHMSHDSGINDRIIHESAKIKREQSAARNDAEVARQIISGVHPNACGEAVQAQKTSTGMMNTAASGREMRKAARASFKRIRNPASEITVINSLPERQRTAEMTGSDAGTMSDAQYVDAMRYRDVIFPTPPRSPESLPEAAKSTPAARDYEKEFKKYEATMDLYYKLYHRDTQLSLRSIEVDTSSSVPSIEKIWRDITSGVPIPAASTATTGNGVSVFPDHWGGVQPASVDGKKYVSERDMIRTKVFMRYANPRYEDDEQYGLASFAGPAGLMKEIIMQAALQNRMLYEIMNAKVHLKQVEGLEGLWEADRAQGERLRQMAAELSR